MNSKRLSINSNPSQLTSVSVPVPVETLYSPLIYSTLSTPNSPSRPLHFDTPKAELIKKERWKRTSLQELESTVEEVNHQYLPQLSEEARAVALEALSRVSYAIDLEKSGTAKLGVLEEAFSKASTSLFDAIKSEPVQKDEEAKYWLKILEVHVNSHLRKVVQMTDSGSKRAPNFVQQLEMENRKLKEDVKSLKTFIDDMKVELNHLKGEGVVLVSRDDKSESSSSSSRSGDSRDYLTRLKQQLSEYLTEEEGERVVSNLQKVVLQGEEILKKLNAARQLASQIRQSDQNVLEQMRHQSSEGDEANTTSTQNSNQTDSPTTSKPEKINQTSNQQPNKATNSNQNPIMQQNTNT